METYVYKTVGPCHIKADVYRSTAGSSPAPVIVYIHGGALIFGSRRGIHPQQRDLYREAGFTVVSIDYRLAPESKLPDIIEDLHDALHWVRTDGPGLFGADPRRLAVVGHSAGGYLALMSGCCVAPPPCAIVAFYGYGDIIGDWYRKPAPYYCRKPALSGQEFIGMQDGPVVAEPSEGREGERFYLYCRQRGLWPREVGGHDPDRDSGFFSAFCPLQNVRAGYPPTLLLHGEQDSDVPFEQSVLMSGALARHGVAHELVALPGRDHGFDGPMEDPVVRGAFDQALRFLRTHTGRVGEDAITTALQRGVPLEPRPFAALGRTLGTTEDAVLGVLRRMLADGSARRFGAVFDARRLGYRSELCAMDVPEADLGRIGSVVAAHPGVTHCYRRGHPPGVPPFPERPDVASIPNLWFALAAWRDSFAGGMAVLEASVAPYAVLRLPAVRRFKLDFVLEPGRRDAGERVPGMSAVYSPPDGDMERMTATDRELVQALEGNIPVRPDLFAGFIAGAGGSEASLLERLRTWERTGTLRRIAMVVGHQRIGLTATAMCIWPVAAGQMVEAGRRLAAWPDVTHCYERPVRPGWPYNLYAMIHTSDWGDTLLLFEQISESAGLARGRLLGSLHEFKKTSMRYFSS